MSDVIIREKNIKLSTSKQTDADHILLLSKALSSPERLLILQHILHRNINIYDLSKELNIPLSSVSRHVDILSDAGLIYTIYQPGKKGHARYCSQALSSFKVIICATAPIEMKDSTYLVELPIGHFSHCHINPPCGMNTFETSLQPFDDRSLFFMPERINAENIWFDKGFISYNFPTPTQGSDYSSIMFSFEVCSETVNYNNTWPSDITIYINDIEILTFTSPGDFGGRRGNHTPLYWPISSTQYGLLKKIFINKKGVFLDEKFISSHLTFDDLHIFDGSAIKLTIGIKKDAIHQGGINLFGKHWGDYPQGIIMLLNKDPSPPTKNK